MESPDVTTRPPGGGASVSSSDLSSELVTPPSYLSHKRRGFGSCSYGGSSSLMHECHVLEVWSRVDSLNTWRICSSSCEIRIMFSHVDVQKGGSSLAVSEAYDSNAKLGGHLRGRNPHHSEQAQSWWLCWKDHNWLQHRRFRCCGVESCSLQPPRDWQ
eukprot:95625-Amphidinium_carterae.4